MVRGGDGERRRRGDGSSLAHPPVKRERGGSGGRRSLVSPQAQPSRVRKIWADDRKNPRTFPTGLVEAHKPPWEDGLHLVGVGLPREV